MGRSSLPDRDLPIVRLQTFYLRSLLFHWRANLAVVFGAAVATSALTGALVVGDSMRASLREVALGRLGPVDHALVSHRFFTTELAGRLAGDADFTRQFSGLSPVILRPGGCVLAEKRTRAERINILGVQPSFWALSGADASIEFPDSRSVIINEPLATELGAQPGDDLLLRLGKPSAISTETLLGRRDDTTATLRLTVSAIVPAESLGGFSLNPRHASPRNAFVPLTTLQRALNQRGRVNGILVADRSRRARESSNDTARLRGLLQEHLRLVDVGLKLRVDGTHGYISLESDGILLEPVVEEAAAEAADAVGAGISPVLTHLANTIALERAPNGSGSTPVIPYSTIAAIDPESPAAAALARSLRDGEVSMGPGEIVLNEWAADDLGAALGDRIAVSYYLTRDFGRLETRSSTFVLRGVVHLRGASADPGFIPEYRGVTDTENLSDWDPPFPIDLSLVRDEDEAYWDAYRTTPKAFIALAEGQRLWAEESERFGRLTSIRFTSISSADESPYLAAMSAALHEALASRLDPARLGLTFDPVRKQALEASKGSTDFGMLFIGFSFFLITSAAMLVALLFRLGVERRSSEVGLLLATGFSAQLVTRLLLAEGAALAVAGGLIGLAGAAGYAWLMLSGLLSWWSDAVNAPFLSLHLSAISLGIGFVAGVLIASGSTAWSVRGLSRRSTRSLLVGSVDEGPTTLAQRRRRWATRTALCSFAAAVGLIGASLMTAAVPPVAAFFAGGAAMLTACLALFARWLRGRPKGVIQKGGVLAIARLAIRNAPRHAGRSMLTAGLIASATFVIVALEAFRLDSGGSVEGRGSGSGGFALYAESALPLGYDLNTPEGREALNVRDTPMDSSSGVTVMPFRLRPGDDSGCLNLYVPTEPRILGASEEMTRRGGFRFGPTTASTDEERANPWTLLDKALPDGAIPAIGDEAAVLWQLHLGLGKDLVITDERGRDLPLRFVALLKGSVLQDEIIVAESHFERLFPSVSGYAFFLIDAPQAEAGDLERALERELDTFGFDVATTERRVAGYMAVQNTYLSTFQTLGGIGLLLGTAGMAAVLLRNVWERRRETALLRALGFSGVAVTAVVLLENVALLFVGLVAGIASALVAIAPNLVSDPASIPWSSLAGTMALVAGSGVLVGVVVTALSVRTPVLASLRTE